MPICPVCDSSRLTVENRNEVFEYGAGRDSVTLSVLIPVNICECGFTFTDDVADTIRHEAVCAHLGILTPAQVKGMRMRLGMSRAEFAKFTKIGEASIARWESGAVTQNLAMDQYLRLLESEDVVEFIRNGMKNRLRKDVDYRFRCIGVIPKELRARAAGFQLRRSN